MSVVELVKSVQPLLDIEGVDDVQLFVNVDEAGSITHVSGNKITINLRTPEYVMVEEDLPSDLVPVENEAQDPGQTESGFPSRRLLRVVRRRSTTS